MSTDLETYSKNAHTAASESGSTAAIILEQDGDEWSLNAYDRDGSLGAYLVATDTVERARILALGRAIVEALDPVPDPPTVDEPLAERERDLLDTPWEGPTLTDKPESAREYHRRLVGEAIGAASMCWAGTPQGVFLDRRASSIVNEILGTWDGDSVPDDACTCPPAELGTVEYVAAEPRLPLDVEIRTIALDAAVRVLEHTGGSLVEGAAKVERFLLGQQDEPAAPAPRWTVGQTLSLDELDALPAGAVVGDRDGDKSTRLDTEEECTYGDAERATWSRRLGARAVVGTKLPARVIANFPPVTLVSLP